MVVKSTDWSSNIRTRSSCCYSKRVRHLRRTSLELHPVIGSMCIMHRMKTRQAISAAILRIKLIATLLTLLTTITACLPSNPPISTSTPLPPTASQTPRPTATITLTPTSTPLTCLTLPGRVEEERAGLVQTVSAVSCLSASML